MAIDYGKMFHELLAQNNDLVKKRDDLEIEIGRLQQLIVATFNLLPIDQKAEVAGLIEKIERESLGLKDAVRILLNAEKDRWFTPPELRDRIKEIGLPLDLGSNPLAVIGTTLKRLVPEDADAKTMDNGQIAYRARKRYQIPADHPIHQLAYKMKAPPNAVPINTDGPSWKKKK